MSGTTTNGYDANGSLTSSTDDGFTTTYTYDVRNKLVGYDGGDDVAGYVYDDSGNRVAETSSGPYIDGGTTLYLTDPQSPTRYAQLIEEKSSATAAPSMTYIAKGVALSGALSGAGDSDPANAAGVWYFKPPCGRRWF